MESSISVTLVFFATAACVVFGFAAFALWVFARLDRDRERDRHEDRNRDRDRGE